MMVHQLVLSFVIVGFFTQQGFTTRDELIQLSECICPGYTLTYQCNLVGHRGATLWNGSLFDCPSKSNQILLRHSEFQDSTSGDCNSEAVIANSIGISLTNSSNQCYSSQLNIAVSPSMNNKTIECNHDNIQQGRVTSIGVRILNFTSEPYPPRVYLRSVDTTQIEFSWDPIPVNCPTVSYRIASSTTCGSCPSATTHTTATCSNPTINDESCSFSVQSVICGSILGSVSEPLQLLPKTADAPLLELTSAEYSCANTTLTVKIQFNVSNPINISDGIDGSATSYTVTYYGLASGNTCSTTNIPASTCIGGICSYLAQIDASMPCIFSANGFSLAASARNIFGNGKSSASLTFILPTCDHSTSSKNCGNCTWIIVVSSVIIIVLVLLTVLLTTVTIIISRRSRSLKKKVMLERVSVYDMVGPPQLLPSPSPGTIENTAYNSIPPQVPPLPSPGTTENTAYNSVPPQVPPLPSPRTKENTAYNSLSESGTKN